MADSIDRTALLEELDWLHEVVNRCNRPSIKELIDRVKSQPTVEPKKGEWIRYDDNEYVVRCPICTKHQLEATNFCPNCGADMRGEDNG